MRRSFVSATYLFAITAHLAGSDVPTRSRIRGPAVTVAFWCRDCAISLYLQRSCALSRILDSARHEGEGDDGYCRGQYVKGQKRNGARGRAGSMASMAPIEISGMP